MLKLANPENIMENMMKSRFGLTVIALLVLFLLSVNNIAIGADRMTYEEYQSKLAEFQARESNANDKMESERSSIEDLNNQISDLEQQITAVWDDIFSFASTNKDDFEQLKSQSDDLASKISEFERLSPDALLNRADELDDLDNMIAELRAMPGSSIGSVFEQLNDLTDRVERLRNAVPQPKHDMYSVISGDHLWRIAGKSNIFNDPWKWMRIYSSNRSEIKDPDLIYPDQRLRIPRQIGREEYLVKKGDSLAKIASSNQVYGDPFKWTKIYQANKENGFIPDPNLIYPEQILFIPGN